MTEVNNYRMPPYDKPILHSQLKTRTDIANEKLSKQDYVRPDLIINNYEQNTNMVYNIKRLPTHCMRLT